jgi:regulatory protein
MTSDPVRRDFHSSSHPPSAWLGDVSDGAAAWAGEGIVSRAAAVESALGPDADPESVARTILLDLLTGRARSRAELRTALAAKRVPGEIADRMLDRFAELGLVDDVAFARSWVESRQAGRGLAPRALATELHRKGIDPETARTAIGDLADDQVEEAARALVRKKLRSLRSVDTTVATRRLLGMLGRKGYSSSLSLRVIREELADEDDLWGDL